MIDNARMKQVLQSYLDAFNRRDAEAITQLYAEDATVEDPVGKAPIRGHDKIRQFYTAAMANGAQLKLSAPIRGSHGKAAAMAFEAHIAAPQGTGVVRIIDVMRFNDEGRIVAMEAYWSQSDMEFKAG